MKPRFFQVQYLHTPAQLVAFYTFTAGLQFTQKYRED